MLINFKFRCIVVRFREKNVFILFKLMFFCDATITFLRLQLNIILLFRSFKDKYCEQIKQSTQGKKN